MKMDRLELANAIAQQINQATGAVGDEISDERARAFKRYMGQPYGDETEDRSSVVSTDISDTIEWIMPELMDVFAGGDKVCSFEPEGPEDEDAAEQETDTLNYIFYRQNDGFMVLYNFLKDAFIQKNGYCKRWWSKKDRVTTEEYEGLSPAEWAKMMADWRKKGWEVEILKEEHEFDEGDEPPDMQAQGMPQPQSVPGPMSPHLAQVDMQNLLPQMQPGMMPMGEPSINVEVKLTRVEEKMMVDSVPVEEIIVSPRWHKISLDDCPFFAHRRAITVSELVEMGYDEQQVMDLPDAFDDELSEEKIERFNARGSSEYDEREEMDKTTREVLVHECYVRVDYDGDGKAELRRVMVGGNAYELLKLADGTDDNEEVETQPISCWTPVPIPHRHYGRSIADLIEDLQRIKTVLFRQMLDNMYLSNNPTREIAEDGLGENTLADLLHERPGKVVRTAMPGHYVEHSPPQFMGQTLPALEYVDQIRENRTGASKLSQGMDSNAINKTMGGQAKLMAASMKKMQLYARICAETGLKHLFMGIHGDLRRNASKGMTLRLRNKYVEVDPRSWAERADMTISVGLGTGDKEIRMAYLTQIIQEQKEHLLAGSPLATLPQLFNSYERFISNAGFKNPEEFFTNPATAEPAPPEPPKPDPVEIMAQVEYAKIKQKAEADKMKIEADVGMSLAKGQREQGALDRKAQAEDAQLQVEMGRSISDSARMERIAKMNDDRERDKMNMEFALRIAEMNAKSGTAIELESIKAAAKMGERMNQPPEANV